MPKQLAEEESIEDEGSESSSLPPLDRTGFMRALEALRRQFAEAADNIACYEVKNCSDCASCMFCTGCKACYRCNYCQGCQDCSHCNQCEGCSSCNACTHCQQCQSCVGSAYLELCTRCSDCTYCFGCVGLQKSDFHILNVPYDRSSYFKMVAKLKRALGLH